MIDERMQNAFNKQINAELYSAYLYLSMAAYSQAINLPGFANWMRVQEQEERFHALKMYDYVISRGGRVVLDKIDAPPVEWASPLAMFEAVAAHEAKVTGLINDLMNVAIEQKDHAAAQFLQWYVNEQVEEESNDAKIVGDLKRAGDTASLIFMLDRELATRVYVPPAAGTTAAGA